MTRRDILRLAAVTPMRGFDATASTRSFWLFGLLNPSCARVTARGNARLHCSNSQREWIAEGRESVEADVSCPALRIAGPGDEMVWCQLEIPGQMRRDFFGIVEISPAQDSLLISLRTSMEVAVNCIIGAELPVSIAGEEALAAQAVVSRSILFAADAPRHECAEFCDTTHCQFFRSPSPMNSKVGSAVQRTYGVVLSQNGRVVAPRYSGACGGRTEAGLNTGVRYLSVACDDCRRRGLARRGHGWGMCQEGAMAMAAQGASYQDILSKYYPTLTGNGFRSANPS